MKQRHGQERGNLKCNEECYKNMQFKLLEDLCAEAILGQEFINLHSEVRINFRGQMYVCALSVSTLPPPLLFNRLSGNCRPIAAKSRNFSKPDKEFISNEVERMLKAGIIIPGNSPWRAQVNITTNGRHKKRLVVDHSNNFDRLTYLGAYPLPKIDEIAAELANYSVFSTVDFRSVYH